MTLKNVLEALVFGSPKPLTGKELAAILSAAAAASDSEEARALAGVGQEEIAAALAELQAEHGTGGRGFRLVEQVHGWTLVTDPEAAPWVRQLYPEAKPTRLSGPALETLAIIAYRQPVTRGDLEAVRGVAVDGVMQVLLDRGLVKITGRAEVPGRPLLYGTTEYFLQHFGLRHTDELPNSGELKRITLPTAPVPEEAEVAGPPKKPKKGKKASPEITEDTEGVATAEAGAAEVPMPQEVREEKTWELSPEERRSAQMQQDEENEDVAAEPGSGLDTSEERDSTSPSA